MSVDRPDDIVKWAEDPASLISEPENERTRGWPFGYLPPADQKNWLQRAVGRWIDHLAQTGSAFDSMAEATEALDVGGSTTIRLHEDVENRPYFRDLVIPFSDTGSVYQVPVTDGRRCFFARTESDGIGVSAFSLVGGRIEEVAATGRQERITVDFDSDGRSFVAAWGDAPGGTPSGDYIVDVFDAEGDLTSPQTLSFTGGEEVTGVSCDGGHILVTTRTETESTDVYEFNIYGYTPENLTLDFTFDLPPNGIISGTNFRSGTARSNGDQIALFVVDQDDNRFVFFFHADGSKPTVSPSSDWPDVVAYTEILSTDTGLMSAGSILWIGPTLYVGTDSAVGSGAVSRINTISFDPSEYQGEVESETVWRGDSLDYGVIAADLSTDGRYLYTSVFDVATNETAIVALDTQRVEHREVTGIADGVIWLAEEYIHHLDDADYDARMSIACDGFYIWASDGDYSGGTNDVRLLSTNTLARRFVRADETSKHRSPFHHTLIPEG